MYLRVKFQVSSIILTRFWTDEFYPLPSPTSKQTPRKPTLIRVNRNGMSLGNLIRDSSYADHDTRPNLKKGFTLIREDNPLNCKRGGVSICFKEHLAVRPVSPLNWHECLLLEINIQNKKGYVISLYRSPSQSKDKLDEFLLNFQQLISNRMS